MSRTYRKLHYSGEIVDEKRGNWPMPSRKKFGIGKLKYASMEDGVPSKVYKREKREQEKENERE